MKKNILSFIILFLTSVHLMGQWTSINSGTTDNLVYITFPDSLNGYIIGSDLFGDGFLLKTSDGGYSWNQIFNNYDVRAINFLNQDTGGIIVNGDSLLITFDGGINWTSAAPNAIGMTGPEKTFFHMFTANDWFIMQSWHVNITNDGGNTWQHTQTTTLVNNDIQGMNDSTVIVCGTYGTPVIKSIDRGYNWINITTQAPHPGTSIANSF